LFLVLFFQVLALQGLDHSLYDSPDLITAQQKGGLLFDILPITKLSVTHDTHDRYDEDEVASSPAAADFNGIRVRLVCTYEQYNAVVAAFLWDEKVRNPVSLL
jgi:hypothetical protein